MAADLAWPLAEIPDAVLERRLGEKEGAAPDA
jgi:hypothetical protein